MRPRILEIKKRLLVGLRAEMSMATDQTALLWKSFMPRRNEIESALGDGFYSLHDYHSGTDFETFGPQTVFTKWAAVQVRQLDDIPDGMYHFEIPNGKYAIFAYQGLASEFQSIANLIYGKWIPKAGLQLDQRPHFTIMPKDYRPNDPKAKEDVWVPVK